MTFNHQPLRKLPLRKTAALLRQHWLPALATIAVVAILWIGAPAWAAPVTQGGTVPDPTATPEDGPVATATPQPDDDDGDESDSNEQGQATPDPSAPNITFQDPGAAPSDLTALVTVDGINLREGPGTTFNPLGTIPANTEVTVLSRSEDGAWWYVCCLPGTQTTGWLSAQLLAPNFDAAQSETLVPIFGSPVTPAAPAGTSQPATQTRPQAGQPLAIASSIYPYFVWQGITATLTITVNNPNTVDAANVLLSDELPATLTLVEATADAGGTVETVTTANDRPLLLFRWPSIPADTAVTATVVVLVSPGLADGEVIDNLVAVRAANAPYSASAITIGLPPVVPPNFQ